MRIKLKIKDVEGMEAGRHILLVNMEDFTETLNDIRGG